MLKDSYISRTSKLLSNIDRLLEFRTRYILRPITLDISPINECNLNCPFCSVQNRDRSEMLMALDTLHIVRKYMNLGIKSVVLTGGGEPTLWPYFDRFVIHCKDIFNLKLGLITNGLKLHEIDSKILGRFDWIRVSLNGLDVGKKPDLSKIPIHVDISANYVWHDQSLPHKQGLQLKEFIEKNPRISALKIQKDIFSKISSNYHIPSFNNDRIFFSEKEDITQIPQVCYMGWIKPHLDANGELYRCVCSAFENRKLEPKHLMPVDIDQTPDNDTFTTSKCKVCFFSKQNNFIHQFIQEKKHADFI